MPAVAPLMVASTRITAPSLSVHTATAESSHSVYPRVISLAAQLSCLYSPLRFASFNPSG